MKRRIGAQGQLITSPGKIEHLARAQRTSPAQQTPQKLDLLRGSKWLRVPFGVNRGLRTRTATRIWCIDICSAATCREHGIVILRRQCSRFRARLDHAARPPALRSLIRGRRCFGCRRRSRPARCAGFFHVFPASTTLARDAADRSDPAAASKPILTSHTVPSAPRATSAATLLASDRRSSPAQIQPVPRTD